MKQQNKEYKIIEENKTNDNLPNLNKNSQKIIENNGFETIIQEVQIKTM